jgi:enterochelin esterase family protein
MKNIFRILLLSILPMITANSQSFQSFIAYLDSLPEEERMTAVDSFMTAAAPDGFPYITGDTANFIYRGNVTSAMVAGDFNGWNPNSTLMTGVAGTDFHYFSKDFEANARLDYKYVVNGSNWILDPLNPNTCSGGFGPNSELAMPGYVQPWEIGSYTGTPQGTVMTDQISSSHTGSTFQLKIYLPVDYDENLPGGYPVVYFQDGYEYISLGYADNVLDNLIDSSLCSPVIGVFVRPNNRNEEYAYDLREEYQQFFAHELLPYIDGKYNTIDQARARAVIGDSFGGNISALIAYNHADLFGNCGLHSGAFWPNDYEAYLLITQGEVKPIRWVSIWGTYEGLWENMRNFRDFLIDNDYDLTWQELPEGHSWGLWRATIDEMVPYFFPPGFMGTEENPFIKENILHIYPNPARDHITVKSATMIKRIQLIDLAGKIIEEKYPGSESVIFPTGNLDQGIYFMRTFSEEGINTVKFIISN